MRDDAERGYGLSYERILRPIPSVRHHVCPSMYPPPQQPLRRSLTHGRACAIMRSRSRHEILPQSLPPRGLSREEAAAYVGVSATKFEQMVVDGRMPKPKRIDGRKVWDRLRLDAAFSALPSEGGDEAETTDDVWERVAV